MREGLECMLFEVDLLAKLKERRKLGQEEQKSVGCKDGYVLRKP